MNSQLSDSIRQKPSYVAIEGCIGVGKTTLSEALAKRLNGKQILEMVEENPFLPDFYKDPATHAFKTQIFFLLSRYKQQQALAQRDLFDQAIVSDYLILKDRIFAELTLKGSELALYEQLYQTLCHHVHMPDLVIHLRAPIDVVVERIKRRGRAYEKDIDVDYLKNLSASYDHFFGTFNACPVLTVETEELNFPERQEDITYVVDAMGETLSHRKSSHLVTAGPTKQTRLFS